jgi:molecular chaperone GrpE
MKKNNDQNTIELLKKEAEDWKSKYLRALADYQNLEKRIITQKEDVRTTATVGFIAKLLPFIDTLEKIENQFDRNAFNISLKQLKDLLQSEGIEKMSVIGKKFDPQIMECIEVDKDNLGDDVINELTAGYKLGDKIIRVAGVKVGKLSPETGK